MNESLSFSHTSATFLGNRASTFFRIVQDFAVASTSNFLASIGWVTFRSWMPHNPRTQLLIFLKCRISVGL